MKSGVWARFFAILLVAIFAITLIVNSTSTTGNVVTRLEGDPKCSGIEGYSAKIVIDKEEKTFSSKYLETAQELQRNWLNANIADCSKAKVEFDGYCSDVFGDCRTEQSACKINDDRVGFDCNTLPQKCTYREENGLYVYDCSVEAKEILLGTCTCKTD